MMWDQMWQRSMIPEVNSSSGLSQETGRHYTESKPEQLAWCLQARWHLVRQESQALCPIWLSLGS